MPKLLSPLLSLVGATAAVFCSISTLSARTVRDHAIEVSGYADGATSSVRLQWPNHYEGGTYTVVRRAVGEPSWTYKLPNSAVTSTGCTDTAITKGVAYEYFVRSRVTAPDGQSYERFSYILVGDKLPLIESRGTVLLLVEASIASPLSAELYRLQRDLIGDGWSVIRKDVPASDDVETVRALIKGEYQKNPVATRAVFLLGHIAVPYSGDIWPDAHADHKGAWPADVIYGDMDGVYTRIGANRYAESNPPMINWKAEAELQVGRVDLSNMPAFGVSEVELLRRYLDKDHAYRHATVKVPRRAIVDDNLGLLAGWEATAANGWRNFPQLVGASNCDVTDWSASIEKPYLLGFGCDYSSFQAVGSVVSTSSYAASNYNVVFNMLFGSYFGDWDNSNNVLRAPLASGLGLASVWGARPNWFIHPLALGATFGECAQLTQSNTGVYDGSVSQNQVHIALMGDPTLRLFPVAPVSGLQVSASGAGAQISWAASPDNVLGYHVYVSDNAFGPYVRLTSNLLTGTTYSYDTSPSGKTFMVRAIKLETTPSGSFYNGSQGVFTSIDGDSGAEPTTVSLTALDATGGEFGPKSAAIRISRTGNLSAALAVNLKISGSAVNGSDYAAIPSKISIPAGAAFVLLNLEPVADDIAEGTEGVQVSVQTGASYQVGAENEALISIQDTPRDGWKTAHFSSSELSDFSISGPDADPDRDGLSNLCAYGFNLDPRQGNGVGRPVTSLASVNGERYLQIAYRRNKRAVDVTFTVEVSDDIGRTWLAGVDQTDVVSVTDIGDGTELVIARDRLPLSAERSRFMRVRLSL